MSKHIVFVAGEESGDQHAAKLLAQLTATSDIIASGMGGKHLERLGMRNLLDLTQVAITGITGVMAHLRSIYKAFKLIKQHLKQVQPDLVILVDYPGFNLRLAKWIKRRVNCPVLYYISPQIWAWKAGRIEIIRRYVDHIAVILPFEYDLYRRENIPVSYVGHPLLESIVKVPSQEHCRQHFLWPLDALILAICPGSRKMEVVKLMPIIVQALIKLQQNQPNLVLKVVIPVAQTLDISWVDSYCKNLPYSYELICGEAQQVMQAADAVVVASGTASLEAALLLKPTCIIYKSSWLNYYLARRWMKVKYLGLANLLLHRMAIPELLQMDCNALELSKMMQLLLCSADWRRRSIQDLEQLRSVLQIQNHDVFPQLVRQLLNILQ